DWSIPLDGLRHWTRPVGIALTAEELESLSSVLAQHFGVEGFRVRWADLADQAIDALRQLGHASADRIPRREVMMAVDLARTSLVMLVAIPGTPFWLMCLLVGSVSLLNPVFKASQLALLPDVLPGGRFA